MTGRILPRRLAERPRPRRAGSPESNLDPSMVPLVGGTSVQKKTVVATLSSLILIGGVFGATKGWLFHSPSVLASPETQNTSPVVDNSPISPPPPPPVDPLSPTIPLGGAALTPLPPELTAQLGLGDETGLLVSDIDEESRAAKAGLRAFDVILSINGEPATPSWNDDSLRDTGAGFELKVSRTGLVRRLAIPGLLNPTEPKKEADGTENSLPVDPFPSSDRLDADHPFRQLESFTSLRASYAQKIDEFSEQMRDLEKKAHQARGEARKEAVRLRKECERKAAAQLETWKKEILSRVDARLDQKRLKSLEDLGLEPDKLLPKKEAESIATRLSTLKETLKSAAKASDENLKDVPERTRRAYQQRMGRIAQESLQLFQERIERPWSSSLREVSDHRERLTKRHRDRISRTHTTFAKIRTELKKRVACAFDRTQKDFAKRLGQRLAKLEAPQEGEIAGCLQDIHDQIDSMARRFLSLTEHALTQFEDRVSGANRQLLPASAQHIRDGQASLADVLHDLEQAKSALRNSKLEPEVPAWNTRSQLTTHGIRYRQGLNRLIDDGRSLTRPHALGLASSFEEHKVVCESSWRDLQRLLGELSREIANDCWKLDGPHLDRRFPGKKKPGRTKMELASLAK